MILIIDNYDSFTYNLYQYIGDLGAKPVVIRNDRIDLEGIRKLKPERIILSPGPGHPGIKRDFGVCRDILDAINDVPILGVCLGHQGIILQFGGSVGKASKPMHGKTSVITHNGKGLFKGIRNPLRVMRYHSLIGTGIPDCLEITARSRDEVMAVSHKEFPISGIQFHPESIMTEDGKRILENFLRC
jgi:anthranilate synthase component 2